MLYAVTVQKEVRYRIKRNRKKGRKPFFFLWKNKRNVLCLVVLILCHARGILQTNPCAKKCTEETKGEKKNMALTRSMLKGMGLTEEQVGAIIDEHTSVTSALKDQIKEYKEDAEKLPDIQKELEKLKDGDNAWKEKYEKEHEAFENYKTDVANKEKSANIRTAYRKLLKDAKLDDDYIDTVMDATKFDGIDLDKDGKLIDSEKLTESIKTKWAKFITTETPKGAQVDNPPAGNKANGANPRAAELARKFAEQHGYVVEGEKT